MASIGRRLKWWQRLFWSKQRRDEYSAVEMLSFMEIAQHCTTNEATEEIKKALSMPSEALKELS